MQAARIADIPWTIGAGLAEIGFTCESFKSSSSTLRCSCGWGRLVCVMMQFSHSVGEEAGRLHQLQGTICENLVTFPQLCTILVLHNRYTADLQGVMYITDSSMLWNRE